MWFIYFLLCVLLPICIPVPEAAVVLWGTRQAGSLGAFILGVAGSVLGLAIMHTLSSMLAGRIFRVCLKNLFPRSAFSADCEVHLTESILQTRSGKKKNKQLIWLQKLTGRYHNWVLGVLMIVPLVSDEVLCAGSVLLKIPLSQFLKIGIIAKIISVGMVAFSGSIGTVCGLKRWQIVAAELFVMFLASAGLQHFCRRKRTVYHEGIHIDC